LADECDDPTALFSGLLNLHPSILSIMYVSWLLRTLAFGTYAELCTAEVTPFDPPTMKTLR